MLVSEVFYRDIPNRQALARYGGLTGSPNESGQKRREKGLSRSGNPRVRNGLIQFAWRFLKFQPDSELACWYRERTRDGRPGIRKKMIVALARKLAQLALSCIFGRYEEQLGNWRRPIVALGIYYAP